MVTKYIEEAIAEKQSQILFLQNEVEELKQQFEAVKGKSGMEKWLNHQFESSSMTTPEFTAFAKDFKNELKKQLSSNCEIVGWSKGHFYISCFVKNTATQKLMYLSTSDVRHFPNSWYNNILIRTAKHEKDWTGGSNHFCRFLEIAIWVERLTK